MSFFLLYINDGSVRWFATRTAAQAEQLRHPGSKVVDLPAELSLLMFLLNPSSGLNDGVDWTETEQEVVRYRPSTTMQKQRFIGAIQLDDFVTVCRMAYAMTDLLINSTGHPTQYREHRQNALHIAARAGSWHTAALILCLVSSPYYTKRHGGCPNELASLLLDYYLNMPEKDERDTPLHLAVRGGWTRTVHVLLSYQQCELRPNARGHYPQQVICHDATLHRNTWKIQRKLSDMLRVGFFVALLCTEGDVEPPTVLEPFSRCSVPTLQPVGGKLCYNVCMLAFAGPMTEMEAHAFYKEWKRSPRLERVSRSQVRCSVTGQLHDAADLKQSATYAELSYRRTYLTDGMVRIGRTLARSKAIGWAEFWPFLSNYCNLSDAATLEHFEHYLEQHADVCRETRPKQDPIAIEGDLEDGQNWRAYAALNGVVYDGCVYPHIRRWQTRMRQFVDFLLDGALGPAGVRKALVSSNVGRISG